MDNHDIVYTNNETRIKETFIMNNKDKIGSGAFGEVYRGYHAKTKVKLAFKMELSTTTTPQLPIEYKVLKLMQGYREDSILVMDLLGKNLEDMIRLNKSRKYSLKTVLMIADQLDYIHRDLKPENFVIGLGDNEDVIYLIDFGLSRKYRNQKTKVHIPYKDGKSIIGTIRYVSIYTHFGIEQSRRDDIESLGYILVYFAKGSLPWQGIKAKTKKEKYKIIMDKKAESKPEVLCSGLPDEFRQYFEYIRGLEFAEKPDYALLKGLFSKLMVKLELVNDSCFDWCKPVETNDVDFYKDNVPRYNISEILDKVEKLQKKTEATQDEENEDEQ